MCKIAFIPFARHNPTLARQIIRLLAPMMSQTDPHGTGYLEVHNNGLRIQRWMNPKRLFKVVKPLDTALTQAIAKYSGALTLADNPGDYSEHGDVGGVPLSIACHARWATTPKCIGNVHPFHEKHDDGETALMHNGVVSNWIGMVKQYGGEECDSWAILRRYIDAQVYGPKPQLDDAFDVIPGSQSCLAANVLNDGQLFVDYWKNNGTTMHAAYVPALSSPVFCTDGGMLKMVLQKLKVKFHFLEVSAYQLIRFHPRTDAVEVFEQGDWQVSMAHSYQTSYTPSSWRGNSQAMANVPSIPESNCHERTTPLVIQGDSEDIDDDTLAINDDSEVASRVDYIRARGKVSRR